MEKDQFVAVDQEPWWLLAGDADDRTEDLRRKLGAAFGQSEPTWYTQRDKLEEVYEFILTQPRVLLEELDLAIDDERRQRWLGSLIESKAPAPVERAAWAPAAAQGASATRAAPPRKAAFGSRAQAASGDAANAAPTAPTAATPPRRSAFGSRAQAGPAAKAGGQAESAAPTSSAPPRRSPFGSRAQAAAGATPDPGPGSAAARGAVPITEQIETVMSALSSEELSSMARQLGLSPQEIQAITADPDFAGMVAEESARLELVGA